MIYSKSCILKKRTGGNFLGKCYVIKHKKINLKPGQT